MNASALQERLPQDAQPDPVLLESLLRVLRDHQPPRDLQPVVGRLIERDTAALRAFGVPA